MNAIVQLWNRHILGARLHIADHFQSVARLTQLALVECVTRETSIYFHTAVYGLSHVLVNYGSVSWLARHTQRIRVLNQIRCSILIVFKHIRQSGRVCSIRLHFVKNVEHLNGAIGWKLILLGHSTFVAIGLFQLLACKQIRLVVHLQICSQSEGANPVCLELIQGKVGVIVIVDGDGEGGNDGFATHLVALMAGEKVIEVFEGRLVHLVRAIIAQIVSQSVDPHV